MQGLPNMEANLSIYIISVHQISKLNEIAREEKILKLKKSRATCTLLLIIAEDLGSLKIILFLVSFHLQIPP